MKALGISIVTAIMLVLLIQRAMSITSQEASLVEKGLSAATGRAGNAYVEDANEQFSAARAGSVGASVSELSYPATPRAASCYAQIAVSPTIIYTTVQSAVNKANAGDTVKVAGYCVGVESWAGVTQTVYISKNITLRGGYTTTDNWEKSDPVANPTTLDAAGLGRVLYITGEGSPTIEGLRITGGNASGLGGGPEGADAGGGVYIITAAATISRTWVLTNTAYDGGGLFLYSSAATLNSNIISGNSAAWYGGGLHLFYSDDAVLDGNTVSNNHAGDSSGGLYLASSDATLNGNTISSNTAVWTGGGLYLNDSNAAFDSNIISGNTADSGAGLRLYQSDVTLNGDIITSNTAVQDGGGVYIAEGGGALTQTGDSIISNNSAKFGGGVYVVNGSVTLNRGRVVSNAAEKNGGGMFIWDGDVTLSRGQIISNSANDNGGGVHIELADVTLNEAQIIKNSAYNNNGGGVYIWEGDVTLSGGQIISNSARHNGGGVHIEKSDATFVQTGVSTITHNTADFGGGVYAWEGSATLSGGQISSNSATWNGGGVYIAWGSAVLSGGQIISNSAHDSGGGVYVKESAAAFVQAANSIIAHNTGSEKGGGVYVRDGSATLSGGQIVGNSAWNGGGLYVEFGSATLSEGHILSNTARQDGGGVYVRESGAAFTQTGVSTIAHNSATFGGGVYSVYGNVTLSGGQIISNSADDNGGGVFVWCGNVKLSGGQISSNSAHNGGGGVYVRESCAVFAQTGVSTITHNTADFGGGVYVWEGSATLSGGQIISNSATTNGGGIYAITPTLISGSQILSNTAQRHGGGLYLHNSDSTLINAVIADNLAGGVGSGLYITNSSPRLWHTTIARNGSTEPTTGGSGIYVASDGPPYSAVALTNTILVSHAVGITVTAGNIATLTATLWGADDWVNGKEWGGDGIVITSGDIWGDPDFVAPDASDYHIGPHSAAIDQGVPVSVNMDIDGDNRFIGGGSDLGADEFPAALRVNKQAVPDPVQAGERLTYTILVTNSGNVNLLAAVTDTLPMNIAPDGMHNGQLISPGGILTWTPTITALGGVWMETFVVTVEKAYVGPLVNVVRVTTNEGVAGAYTETTWAHTCWARLNNESKDYHTVQAAVDDAKAGDTVKVAGYCVGVETRAEVTQTVYISENITLRGGYTTTNWTQPDPEANPTTLNALGQGRVIYIKGDISATVEGLRITGGDARGLGSGTEKTDTGGGVYVIDATAIISRTWVFSNTAYNGNGGGINNKDANLTLIDAFITNNTVSGTWPSGLGGGIHVESGSVTLSGGQISGNYAPNGGGMYIDKGNVTLSGGQITDNSAVDGGGVWVEITAAFTQTGASVIAHNEADDRGGGICVWEGRATLNGGQIISNSAGESGGGIYVHDEPATFVQTSVSTIADNSANYGGGVYVLSGTAILNGGQIIGNEAKFYGGGVYVSQSTVAFTLTGVSTIARNSAGYGGGIYLKDGPNLIQGGIISANHAITNGGGIHLASGAMAQVLDNQISDNTASSAGGGVYISGNAAPVLHSNQILSNTAVKSGGGIYVGSGIQTPTIINNTVISNTSWSTAGGGGGIYVTGSPTLIQGNTVSGNHAALNRGGGIYLTGGTTAQVIGNDILNNEAAKYGGGIYVRDSPAMIQSNHISANRAITDGGGIYLTGDITATVLGNYILDNEAYDDGGGVSVRLSAPYLENNIVAGNQAGDNGSGLYFSGSSSRLLHTTVARNGGEDDHGIFVTYATVADTTYYSAIAMTNTILVSHGMGVYVAADNTAMLTATLWGADIWANDTESGGEGTIITESVNIWGLPIFVDADAGDYHISSGSAAIDTGVDAGVIVDIDGDLRPMNHRFDVGADELIVHIIYLPLIMRELPTPILSPIDNSDDDGNYTVQWDPITDTQFPIIAYTLEENQVCDYGLVAPVEFDTGASTSHIFTNQKAGRYCYHVRARNNWGMDTDWSNQECADVLWEYTDNYWYEQADGPLCSETTYFGYSNNMQDDWFKFYHTGGQITVDLSNHACEKKGLQLQLQYQQGNDPPKMCDLAICYRHGIPYSIEYTDAPAGWYYVKLFIPPSADCRNDVTPYTLQVTFSQSQNQQR